MQKVIVRPEGDPASPIALVGEAPGEEEEKHGVPFYKHAAAGSLLNTQLEIAGIPRHNCYITNVVKERPPGNNIDVFIRKTRSGIVTTPEYDKYEEALRIELKMIKANVVVALGNPALYALTRHWGITQWRGSLLHSPFIDKKVIPTFHPSASLRGQYIWRHLIARDLRLVNSESSTPDVVLPKRNIRVQPTFDEVMQYLMHVPPMIGFDIEVLRKELSCFSLARAWDDVIVVPLTKNNVPYFTPEHEATIMKMLASILEDEEIKKVGHNLLFDSSFLYMKYGIRMTNIDDTMVAHRILYPDFKAGLDFVTSEYTRQPYYKLDGKMHMKYGTSEDKFWIYSGLDSAIALEAFPKIMARLDKNVKAYYRQVATIEPLLFMYARGVKVDVEGMADKAKDCDKRLETLEARLDRQVGHPLNPNSPQQVQAYFYDEKGIKPYTKWVKKESGRKERTVTTDENAMIRIARKGYPEAQTILDIRGLKKLKGTYLTFKMDEDQRLRSSVNPVGTKNGRFSSSKTIFGTGMNLQNQPPEIKKFLKVDDGYVGYEPDLATAETRVVAAIGPVPSLLEAFEKGEDIHRLTAGLMFGKDPRDVSDEDGSSSLGTGRYSERFWGKKTNHELAYDLGYRKFAIQYQLPEKDAKELITSWHRIYPEVRASYHAWVKEALRSTKRLTNLFGRTRIFLGEWGDDLFRDAYAFTPQSTIPDLINERGLLKIHHDQERFKYVEQLNQVHDSIWLQIPISAGWRYHATALLELKASLEQPLHWKGIEFIIPVDLKMGTDFKDMNKVHYSGRGIDDLAATLQAGYEELAS